MTKDEAILEIEKGKKLTHYYFTADEYVFMNYAGLYETEDRVAVTKELFWTYHFDEIFNDEWEFYD